mmetsp:Transcript_8473/g.15410  ORF Transcript_8473/g.15410 Transcript_8473/m.15410 type:complete len:256 (+) Transcript_8473:3-770(+)
MIITHILLFTIFVVATSYELPDLPRIILLRGGNIDDIRDDIVDNTLPKAQSQPLPRDDLNSINYSFKGPPSKGPPSSRRSQPPSSQKSNPKIPIIRRNYPLIVHLFPSTSPSTLRLHLLTTFSTLNSLLLLTWLYLTFLKSIISPFTFLASTFLLNLPHLGPFLRNLSSSNSSKIVKITTFLSVYAKVYSHVRPRKCGVKMEYDDFKLNEYEYGMIERPSDWWDLVAASGLLNCYVAGNFRRVRKRYGTAGAAMR